VIFSANEPEEARTTTKRTPRKVKVNSIVVLVLVKNERNYFHYTLFKNTFTNLKC